MGLRGQTQVSRLGHKHPQPACQPLRQGFAREHGSALNPKSCYLSLLSAGIIGACNQSCLNIVFEMLKSLRTVSALECGESCPACRDALAGVSRHRWVDRHTVFLFAPLLSPFCSSRSHICLAVVISGNISRPTVLECK